MASETSWPGSIGVVGAGAMGSALAAGFIWAGRSVMVSDIRPEIAAASADAEGAQLGSVEQATACDLVCLAVKPGDAAGLLGDLADGSDEGVVLSVMAGWPLDRLADALPGRGLVRTMPNLAVRHGAGLVAVATRGVDPEREAALLEVLDALGTAVPLPETAFPVATALAGSGPGFVALVAEALEDGAVAAGLPRAEARRMVPAVLAGTATLLADGGDPAELRQRVSSPGGTTIAGVSALERGGVRAHIADAVRAAAARAAEL